MLLYKVILKIDFVRCYTSLNKHKFDRLKKMEQEKEQEYHLFTQHSKLFKSTYWGAFKRKIHHKDSEFEQIIKNRDEFVIEYMIDRSVSVCKIPNYVYAHTKGHGAKFDHTEFYVDHAGNWVIVNSPYGKESEHAPALLQHGWKVWKPLYSMNATTFVKVVEKQSKSKK